MSPFSRIDPSDYLAENDLAFAVYDIEPETPGHALVITKRETPNWFTATPDELLAIIALIDEVRGGIDREYGPTGFTIGTNVGLDGGQTIRHLHVHVIPRYPDDGLERHGVRKLLDVG